MFYLLLCVIYYLFAFIASVLLYIILVRSNNSLQVIAETSIAESSSQTIRSLIQWTTATAQ